MKTTPISATIAAIGAALVLPATGTLLANGETFFSPAAGTHVELVYFGRVKDAQTGRPIQKQPYVSIVDALTGIYMPFQGDGPGHFRSPDLGAAILDVSSRPIDTSQFEITVSAAGYETTKVKYIPRRSTGNIELTVKLKPRGNAASAGTSAPAVAASEATGSGGADDAPTDSSRPTFFLLAACFGVAAISAVARKVGRPESTDR
jgi:hypothetical protein